MRFCFHFIFLLTYSVPNPVRSELCFALGSGSDQTWYCGTDKKYTLCNKRYLQLFKVTDGPKEMV